MNSPDLTTPTAADLERFASIVGSANVLTDAADTAAYLREWRDRYVGRTAAVLRPRTTAEVSAILAHANSRRLGVVPQGGNTGLVGGQIPFETGTEIVLSLARLTGIRRDGPHHRSLVAQAGVTLSEVQEQADAIERHFPLSLASEGTCQIGGNIATNAGGTAVLAYGTMRDLTLGLEVVLADGRILDLLNPLKKDNTGYDLKNLFVGSEGTLGIVTTARLKLFPKPASYETAFVSCPSLDHVGSLYSALSDRHGAVLTTFEFMPVRALRFLARHVEGARPPLGLKAPWYVLVELSLFDRHEAADAGDMLEGALADALQAGIISDAALAASQAQRSDFWRLREEMSDVQKKEGGSIKHDVSVPVDAIPTFIARADDLVEQICPGARPVPFGHFGDGNVHYNVSQPPGADRDAFLAQWETLSEAVHDLVTGLGGSISAEHGIGRMKRAELARRKDPVALAVMRAIKSVLDPNGILNPGKLL